MTRHLRLTVEYLPEKVFLGTSEDVPGLVVQAETMPLLLEYADDISRIIFEYREGQVCTDKLEFEVNEVPYVEAA